jgi:hypothetical protein
MAIAREFENIRLQHEEVAEFDYRPGACRKTYRVVVVRKHLSQKLKSQKQALLRMEFKTYVNAWMQMPCQIVRAHAADCVSIAVVESLAGGVLAAGRPFATAAAMLAPDRLEAGVRMLRSVETPSPRKFEPNAATTTRSSSHPA